MWTLTLFSLCSFLLTLTFSQQKHYNGFNFLNGNWGGYTVYPPPKYDTNDSLSMVNLQIEQTNINSISICFLWTQQNISSTYIYKLPNTPTDEQLTSIINYSHSKGLKVVLRPGVNPSDGQWRGSIGKYWASNSEEWNLWFSNYTAFMVYYAKLAQSLNVEIYSVGFELATTISQTNLWNDCINQIKASYRGLTVYGANWGNENKVHFWNNLDFIGIDAYYPLDPSNQNPTVANLETAWQPLINDFKNLSAVNNNKKIMFSEIGYCSTIGANVNPAFCGSTVSMEAQNNCYTAFFNAVYNQEFFIGVFWWQWATDPNDEGQQNKGFTVNNKPAANICKQNFN